MKKRTTLTPHKTTSSATMGWIRNLAAVAILALGLGLGWVWRDSTTAKVVHIDATKVFESFTLTRELDSKLTNTKQSRETVLQTLQLRLERMNNASTPNVDSLQMLAGEFTRRQTQFEEDTEAQAQEYNAQIWTQLNQYMQDYCDQHQLAYILGATGTGNIMGAAPDRDITDDIIQYVNQRYSGAI